MESPAAFFAIILTVYEVPFTTPELIVIGIVVPTVVYVPPFKEYAYPVIALPLFAGAVKLTVNELLPPVIELIVGLAGTVNGVPDNGSDAVEVPTALVAVILTVYEVPFTTPELIVIGIVVPTVVYVPPFKEYAYPVIALPLFAGAVKLTVNELLPPVIELITGLSGTGDSNGV